MPLKTQHSPAKALLVFDGDCGFCRYWIRHWQWVTGDRIDYAPSQEVAESFPDIPREAFAESVCLIEPDGAVYGGAEAVARSLAKTRGYGGFLVIYRHIPGVRPASEWAYRLIARYRPAAMRLTNWLWGATPRPHTYFLSRWLFLRLLGIVYLAAFLSLWVQIQGLIGHNGILPISEFMQSLSHGTGLERFWENPTICWLNDSDLFLHCLCGGGVICSLALIFNLAPALMLLMLWILYLSLCIVGQVFLEFQWDMLLLETGLLAIFFAPWQIRHRLAKEHPPSPLALWLLRWLLFRLMFSSGMVKFLSDDAWRDLSALNYHFETQPLPTWIGWWVHQLPHSVHSVLTFLMFVVELGVPFLIFTPRRPRFIAFTLLTLLQIIILLTGNYAFFNWLTITLCVLLLDDGYLRRIFPRQGRLMPKIIGNYDQLLCGKAPAVPAALGYDSNRRPLMQTITLRIAAVFILIISTTMMIGRFTRMNGLPEPCISLLRASLPLRSINSYGLFAVMTRTRPEIIIEGSNDGEHWQAYEFKWKPGDLHRRPGFVAPHQPRLDWQMWFAALGNYSMNPWLINCMGRLLEGSPAVIGLLRYNPFPAHPPKMIRAMIYEYHFTNRNELHESGEWLRRDLLGNYAPMLQLRNP